jgi:hypothetical protein
MLRLLLEAAGDLRLEGRNAEGAKAETQATERARAKVFMVQQLGQGLISERMRTVVKRFEACRVEVRLPVFELPLTDVCQKMILAFLFTWWR